MSNFNAVDYAVLAFWGFSILAGFVRGFLKEVISLVTWGAACVVSSMFAGKLAAYFAGSSAGTAVDAAVGGFAVNSVQSGSMVQLAGSFAAIFVTTLLAGAAVNYVLTSVTTGMLGLSNRLFGSVFGAMRGYLIIIVLMFVVGLTPFAQQEIWMQSQFVNSFQPTVTWFGQMVDPAIATLKTRAQDAAQGMSGVMPSIPENLLQGPAP